MAKIVLMEDDPDQSKALGELLTFSGHNVIRASTNEEAFAAINDSFDVDLLITDIFAPNDASVPIERGITLIRDVRESEDDHVRSLPIMSISGIRFSRSSAYSFDDPKTFGSDLHLAKPFGLDRLLAAVDQILDTPKKVKRA